MGFFKLFKLNNCVAGHMRSGTQGGKKRLSDSLELELHVVVSHQMWMLGLNVGPLKTASVLDL